MKKTVLCDFDGVLHSYTSGWKGAEIIPDPPNAGAMEWLDLMIEDPEIELVIWTSRVHGDENGRGEQAIRNWLFLHGLSEDKSEEIDITSDKRPAVLMIDDRGFQFEGFFPGPQSIKDFEPWSSK